MSVETITLGCRLNFAESETIARTAPADEDWVVVNSCAVTNEAVRQTRQAIRRAHRERPDARILVTGCAAELEPQSFAAMPGVSRVAGNANKLNALAANDVMTPVPAGFMRKVQQLRRGADRVRPPLHLLLDLAGARAEPVVTRSKRSAMPSPARSTAAPGRSC